jgi:hypothetical protein
MKIWNTNYMDSSSPELFDDLHTVIINFCTTVRQNRKARPESIGQSITLMRRDTDTIVGVF